jgi:uncharacterized membrane protein
MSEEKELFKYIAIGYVLSITLFFFLNNIFDLRLLFEDLYIDKYRAEITIDKNLKLAEYIDFHVDENEKFKMLFRYFEAPLTYKEKLKKPFIELKNITGEQEVYMKDYKGKVHFVNDDYLTSYIEANAYNNEIGMINIHGFEAGNYKMKAFYRLYPPMHIDDKYTHLNFKFFGPNHVPYRNVEIYIHDPKNLILKIYPHIPSYKIEKKENGYLIKGNAYAGIVEVEFLTKRYIFNTFIKKTENIEEKVSNANLSYSYYRKIFDTIKNLLYIATFSFPIWAYILYIKFGKEKNFTVPEFLSFVPNKKRTPYEVNLLFSGDASKTDLNAFLATLLDLHRKKKIQLSVEGYDLIIKVLDEKGDTPYENKVLNFLKETGHKVNNHIEFSLNELDEKIKEAKEAKDINTLRFYKSLFDDIAHYVDNTEVEKTLDKRGKIIISIIFVLSLMLTVGLIILGFLIGEKFVLYHYDLYPLFISSLALSVETSILFKTPTQIFGRWRADFYKEYLEWQAFRNMLSDLAMIKKYSPRDLSIWKDWLIYGTALGVAKNVEKAMKDLNIRIPDIPTETVEYVNYIPASYIALNEAYSYTQSNQNDDISGGFGGFGGFGIGGGFGGGGIGGR